MLQIVKTKKDAHKGLTNINQVMKCDMGKDLKPYKSDMTQVLHSCKLLDEIDMSLQKELMPETDKKSKEMLANQLSNGLFDIMNSDKMDIDQHIEFNQSGMDKLNKMTDKLNEVLGKQGGSRKQQAKTIASMIE
jgi:hypothetical protein